LDAEAVPQRSPPKQLGRLVFVAGCFRGSRLDKAPAVLLLADLLAAGWASALDWVHSALERLPQLHLR